MQWREKNWANTIIAFNPALLWTDVTMYHARVAEICQHVRMCFCFFPLALFAFWGGILLLFVEISKSPDAVLYSCILVSVLYSCHGVVTVAEICQRMSVLRDAQVCFFLRKKSRKQKITRVFEFRCAAAAC